MVAYSFKQRFVEAIRGGTKRQTIRADRRRHARPGEEVQLYCGMRTRGCFLIARARCIETLPIELSFVSRCIVIGTRATIVGRQNRDAFARADGFDTWDDMMAFWRQEHPHVGPSFCGVLVSWRPESQKESQ